MQERRTTRAFTLVELLVVIAIIGMLASALVPAIQSVRSQSRRAQCKSHMLQLIMAVQNYELAREQYPAGVTETAPGPIQSVAQGHHHSWLIPLLPFLDEGSVYRRIDPEVSVYDPNHAQVRALSLPGLVCPSELSTTNLTHSNYAACHHDVEAPIDHDNHGVFFLNSRTTADDVRDGLAHTIFLGEKINDASDLGWMSGTRATLRNTGTTINRRRGGLAATAATLISEEVPPDAGENLGQGDEVAVTGGPAVAARPLAVGGFASRHADGVHHAFGDGRIQFMTPMISPQVYQQLGHRDDGQLLNAGDYRE